MKTKHEQLSKYIIPFVVDGLSIKERKFPKKILYTVIENGVLKPDHTKLLEIYNSNFYQKETALSYEAFNNVIKDIFIYDIKSSFYLALMYIYGDWMETLEESDVMERKSSEISIESHKLLEKISNDEEFIKEWFDYEDVVGHYQEWEYEENGNKAMYDNIDEEYRVFHKTAGLIYKNSWMLSEVEYKLFKEKEHLFKEVLFDQ